ncbi:hypothetical protein [Halalkalibacterium halodurans]|uniref:hypothetical protein n=1 Tax=Halalkalibacterium halodurans TaxID=86665 RepID=UPI002AA9D145|nr:hypothetical protein [Halalkalibacterium halodurans]MDY7224705.1 hypothetical protein [Halalkalibacterium halodurans]MDY7243220.1 hypothetical protein [Halalkalibacterium halodurans]
MNQFISFVQELFPSISPYTADKTREAISHYIKEKGKIETCSPYPFDYLTQGDIISDMPFVFTDEDNLDNEFMGKGMLLTNTCDAERERQLLFAPVMHISVYLNDGLDEANIRNNKYTKLYYLPSAVLKDHVVDLNIVNTYSRVLINKLLDQGIIKRVATLNSFGYYLLLAKLTVHFMRPEDYVTNISRETLGA